MIEKPHIWLSSYVSDLSLMAEIFVRERRTEVIFLRDRMTIISGKENDELSLTVYPEVFLEYMVVAPTYLAFDSKMFGYRLKELDGDEIINMWHQKDSREICWNTDGEPICYHLYWYEYNFKGRLSRLATPTFEILVNSDAFKYVILRFVSDQIVKFEYDGTILRVGKTWISAIKVIKPRPISFYVPRMNLLTILHFKLPEYIVLSVVGDKLIIKAVEIDVIGRPYYELVYTTVIEKG